MVAFGYIWITQESLVVALCFLCVCVTTLFANAIGLSYGRYNEVQVVHNLFVCNLLAECFNTVEPPTMDPLMSATLFYNKR